MIRLAIIAFIVIFLLWYLRSFFLPSKEKGSGDATEMVLDPNCETYVPRAEAVARRILGEDHCFCSEKCALEYQKKQEGSA